MTESLVIFVDFLKWALLAVGGAAVFFIKKTLKDIENKQDELKSDLKQLEVDVSNVKLDYMSKTDFKEFKVEIKEILTALRHDILGMKNEKR